MLSRLEIKDVFKSGSKYRRRLAGPTRAGRVPPVPLTGVQSHKYSTKFEKNFGFSFFLNKLKNLLDSDMKKKYFGTQKYLFTSMIEYHSILTSEYVIIIS